MKQTTAIKIQSVKTVNDYLQILLKNFDCVNCKPGRLSKATVIYTITNALSPQNSILVQNMKTKALETENIKQFIEVIQANFNCNQEFTPKASQELVSNTAKLILLVNLKEIDEMPASENKKPSLKPAPEIKPPVTTKKKR